MRGPFLLVWTFVYFFQIWISGTFFWESCREQARVYANWTRQYLIFHLCVCNGDSSSDKGNRCWLKCTPVLLQQSRTGWCQGFPGLILNSGERHLVQTSWSILQEFLWKLTIQMLSTAEFFVLQRWFRLYGFWITWPGRNKRIWSFLSWERTTEMYVIYPTAYRSSYLYLSPLICHHAT